MYFFLTCIFPQAVCCGVPLGQKLVRLVRAMAAHPSVICPPLCPPWPRALISALRPCVLSLSARFWLFIRSLSAFVWVYGLCPLDGMGAFVFCLPSSRSLCRAWLCLFPLFVLVTFAHAWLRASLHPVFCFDRPLPLSG